MWKYLIKELIIKNERGNKMRGIILVGGCRSTLLNAVDSLNGRFEMSKLRNNGFNSLPVYKNALSCSFKDVED